MKKRICALLALLTVMSCLTACSFTQNIIGAPKTMVVSNSKVRIMIEYLAANDMSGAKLMLHPRAGESLDVVLGQMRDYLGGRNIFTLGTRDACISTTIGASGEIMQETCTFEVIMRDDSSFYVYATYLSDSEGEGLTDLQFVFGAE